MTTALQALAEALAAVEADPTNATLRRAEEARNAVAADRTAMVSR